MKTSIKDCEYCNTEFIAKRSDAKFCSGACKQNAYLERVKGDHEQKKFNTLMQEYQLAERIRQLEHRIIEVQKKKEAQLQQERIEQSTYINNLFANFKNDEIKQHIRNTDKMLKGWLKQLLTFDKEEETYSFKVKSLCNDIICFSHSSRFSDLPEDYQHRKFMNDTLFPKINNWYNEIKYSREKCLALHLSDELKVQFTHVLSLIAG